MRLKLIACEILFRELCTVCARSPHRVDVEFLSKGLHDIGQKKMSAALRETLAAVDQSEYDAVLLGYGLCNNGIVGLGLDRIPLVVPRGHDCITFFLGSKESYHEYFHANPGVYFQTSGWLERGIDLDQLGQDAMETVFGPARSYEEMVEEYGEESAQYIQEQLGDLTANYDRIAYIAMGLETDARFETLAREQADEKGWGFEKLNGELRLLQDFVDGKWDDIRFLVVPPGGKIAPSYDAEIVELR